MNLKAGDTVKIKSLDWYNANKDKNGYIFDGICFDKHVSRDCGKDATVRAINGNIIIEVFCGLNTWFLQEWMLEPKEEIIETKIDLSKNAIIDPPVRCWVRNAEEEEWGYYNSLLSIDHRKTYPYNVKGNTFDSMDYRFCSLEDPNIPKESYIPYTYEDFAEIRGLWVRKKDSYAQSIIESLNYNFIFLANSGIGINYVDAFKDLEIVNSDRTTRPFGKKVQ